MSLDVWSRDDIRNVLLAANGSAATEPTGGDPVEGQTSFRDGYEAALAVIATAFGIPLAARGRLRSPGVVVPGARLAVSYRAGLALDRLLQQREEWRT